MLPRSSTSSSSRCAPTPDVAVLHLVRHAQASAGWGDDDDPGLSDLGVRQAEVVAGQLAGQLDPRPILVSPLRRTRQTAVPLAERWGCEVVVDPTIGEIPSPTADLTARAEWLDGALRSQFADLDEGVASWRAALLASVRSLDHDAVLVTHFVAINAIVGASLGSDAVTTFLPGNTSVTVVAVDSASGEIVVRERGVEAPPVVG